MSWDHDKYQAECRKCGHTGFVILSSDDWGRSSTSWEGFQNKAPHLTEVARMRAGPRDFSPVCECGSRDVVRGKYIGQCNLEGKVISG
jgi:hypothetical protein